MNAPAAIPPEHLAHLSRRVSIIAASRGPGLRPSIMRALGCEVKHEPLRIAVLLSGHAAARVLEDARNTDWIAVVFSEPSTHRTVQFKGREITFAPAGWAEHRLAADYVERLVAELSGLGYPADVIRAVLAHEPGDLVRVEFTPVLSVDQTPGSRMAALVPAQEDRRGS